MSPLQRWKQLELYSEYPSQPARDTSSVEFIASRLTESPTGQIRLMESILERSNMNRAIKKSVDYALSVMQTTVSSLSEANGQGTE